MAEKFYRNKEGKLVYSAIPSVGIQNNFPCAEMHGYQKNGFPSSTPNKIEDDNIWAAFFGKRHEVVACN